MKIVRNTKNLPGKDTGIELALTIRKVTGTIWYLVVLCDLARHSHGPSFVLRFSEQGKDVRNGEVPTKLWTLQKTLSWTAE